ncbi:RNA-directed RNA polymerase VP1 [Ceratobasidium sp. AG-Ba]|nr:RNA-directed RNA polymerase VP1 [Ceratobasidium sp. AG-Ba]
MHTCQALDTPGQIHINSLPEEILLAILEFMIDKNRAIFYKEDESHDLYKRTTLVISVCRRWRRAVLDVPAFWSLVPYLSRNFYSSGGSLTELWLERGKGAPLDLVVGIQDNLDSGLHRYASVLAKSHVAARVRSISVCVSNAYKAFLLLVKLMRSEAHRSVTELSVANPSSLPSVVELPTEFSTSKEAAASRIRMFQRALRIVRLRSLTLQSTSCIFEGLIELELHEIYGLETLGLVNIMDVSSSNVPFRATLFTS